MTNPEAEAACPRPLRRDAEVNLRRILGAARDVFAEAGFDASMETIAARADVGVGTLYRRFPHKADLFNAVVEDARARTRQIADEVLSDVPAGDAVFEFVRRCVAVPGCWRATITAPPWSSGARAALERIAPLLDEILTRSQDAGTVRRDAAVTDIVVVLMAVRSVADLCDARVPDSSARFLELALDGLRPDHRALSPGPISLDALGSIFGDD